MKNKSILFSGDDFSIGRCFANSNEECWSNSGKDAFHKAVNDNNRDNCGFESDFITEITNRQYPNVRSLQNVADRHNCDIDFSEIWSDLLRDVCVYGEYWDYC